MRQLQQDDRFWLSAFGFRLQLGVEKNGEKVEGCGCGYGLWVKV
jgi:hypothetical protein